MVNSKLYIAAAIGIVLMSACDPDARDRRNPLDASNVFTSGRPQNLRSLGNHESVGLSWNRVPLSDVVGYRLYRTDANGNVTTTEVFGTPPPNEFVDENVLNGETYEYKFSVLIGDRLNPLESEISNSVFTSPGPESCWVIDEGLGFVLKVTSDARAISLSVVSVFGARHIAVDPRDGAAWLTTEFGGPGQGGIAVRYTAAGTKSAEVSGFRLPGPIGVDPNDGAVWVADEGSGDGDAQIVRATERGIPIFRFTDVVKPTAIAVDGNSGSAWIGDSGDHTVSLLSNLSVRLATVANMGLPSEIAVNASTGACWVIDSSSASVFRLDPDGSVSASITGFTEPTSLAYSIVTNDCWIIDSGTASILRISDSVSGSYDVSQSQSFHTIITGLVLPSGITIDDTNGHVWVSDLALTSLLKYSINGVEVARYAGLIAPATIAVDPGPRSITFIP